MLNDALWRLRPPNDSILPWLAAAAATVFSVLFPLALILGLHVFAAAFLMRYGSAYSACLVGCAFCMAPVQPLFPVTGIMGFAVLVTLVQPETQTAFAEFRRRRLETKEQQKLHNEFARRRL